MNEYAGLCQTQDMPRQQQQQQPHHRMIMTKTDCYVAGWLQLQDILLVQRLNSVIVQVQIFYIVHMTK